MTDTTTTITPEERTELRRLAGKATKLPYFYTHNPDALSHVVHSEKHNEGSIGSWLWERDARYVVAACNAVPRLLTALEAAEAEREIQRNVILAAQLEGMTHEYNEQKDRAEQAEAERDRLRDQLAALTGEQEDCKLHPCPYSREGLNCGVISLANNRTHAAWTKVFRLQKMVDWLAGELAELHDTSLRLVDGAPDGSNRKPYWKEAAEARAVAESEVK